MRIEEVSGTGWVSELLTSADAGPALAARQIVCTAAALEASVLAAYVDEALLFGRRGDDTELRLRCVAAELGAALRLNDRTVQRRMQEAHTLVHQFPAAHAALRDAEITAGHARVIVDVGLPVPEEAREEYTARALELARVESPNRLKPMLVAVAEAVQPVGITERHREARKARCVWVSDEPDGMSVLHALLPSVLAHGIADRVDELARGVKEAARKEARSAAAPADARSRPAGSLKGASADASGGSSVGVAGDAVGADAADGRTLMQIRADVLADLLASGRPSAVPDELVDVRGQVSVTVPVLTLAGRSDDGAVLDGVGPIDADTARALAGGTTGWDRVMTHPVTGCVLAVDRYKPGKDLKRFLRVRDVHCRFPGCRMPARRSDIDHSLDWARGGKTHRDNLAHLCEHHHTVKHAAGWTIRQHGGGVLEFTSPQGRSYIDSPPPRGVVFVPDDPPRVSSGLTTCVPRGRVRQREALRGVPTSSRDRAPTELTAPF